MKLINVIVTSRNIVHKMWTFKDTKVGRSASKQRYAYECVLRSTALMKRYGFTHKDVDKPFTFNVFMKSWGKVLVSEEYRILIENNFVYGSGNVLLINSEIS